MKTWVILGLLATVWAVRLKTGKAGEAGEAGEAKIHQYVVGPPAMVNFYMEEP